jgi:hypothetical protein
MEVDIMRGFEASARGVASEPVESLFGARLGPAGGAGSNVGFSLPPSHSLTRDTSPRVYNEAIFS